MKWSFHRFAATLAAICNAMASVSSTGIAPRFRRFIVPDEEQRRATGSRGTS